MKASKYNFFLPAVDDKWLIFNALSHSTLMVDKEAKALLENEELDNLDSKTLQLLERNGIIVDSEFDERKKFKYLYEKEKFEKRPLGFSLTLTYKCNLSCSYCYQGRGELRTDSMNEETMNSAIKFIKKTVEQRNADEILLHFYGGEPLLEVKKIFKFLKELRPYIGTAMIDSNGVLFTKEIASRLGIYPTLFETTLAGPKDLHNERRPSKSGEGTYEKIINGIQNALSESMKVHLRIDIDEEIYNRVDELLDDLSERGIQKKQMVVSFNRIEPMLKGSDYPTSLLTEKPVNFLYELAIEKGFPVQLGGYPGCLACYQQSTNWFSIDPGGFFYPCEGFFGFEDQKTGKIGKNGDILEHYPPYYDWHLRDPLSIEECRDCKILPLCGGGCPFKAYLKYGNYNGPDCPWYAQTPKSYIAQYLISKDYDKFNNLIDRSKLE
ncbi:MAG: hypothetical protein AYK19_22160 [Theionarchaea archaeon DG-70-1]|nr:MAG: hypothetical protein AYK19_22160 [Theionarchaea archaeon DG-70-1]